MVIVDNGCLRAKLRELDKTKNSEIHRFLDVLISDYLLEKIITPNSEFRTPNSL